MRLVRCGLEHLDLIDALRLGMPDTDVFASLTPAQREAVAHVDGPLLILAGPGTGKTRVVTHRIASLLQQGIPPRQVLALTFTNKAADEMRQRVHRLTGTHGVWLGTFHGFCARLLRQHAPLAGLHENYSIYDTDDSRKTLQQAIQESGVVLTHTTPDTVAKAISWAKNNLITAEEYSPRSGHATGSLVQRIYPAYQKRLVESNAVDFDDLLLHVAVLLRQNPELRSDLDARYRYLLVDEYQDTNLAQYAIVRALSIDFPNLAATGDPDQSIYGWRGANLSNILEFEKDFPQVKVVRLEQNYRSTPNILRVADHLISHNVRRKAKRLYTEHAEGVPVRLMFYATEREEALSIVRQIADETQAGRRRACDFAIFYRVNVLSRQFEHALRALSIPYQIVNGLEFYQRREIKDVLAYLHLLNNPQDDVAFLRIVNLPTRGIGQKTIDRLTQHARRQRLSLLDAARESGRIESIPKRTVTLVAKFVAMYDRMAAKAGGSLWQVLDCALHESGYRDWLASSTAEEDRDRLDNIQELLTAAEEFDRQSSAEGHCLERFLEQASLASDTDAFEPDLDRVTLMTLHAAKGLEFPVVFLVAVEEGLLPHERSHEDAEKLEEERRLLFVGMTRAKQELQLSLAQYRSFRGERRGAVPSQFLIELPREEIRICESASQDFDDEESLESGRYGKDEPPAEVWSDDEFVQEAPAAPARRRAKLPTAAERWDDVDQTPRSPASAAVFQPGVVVMHPEYGCGTIVAASGTGQKRMVRVQFFEGDVPKSFLLAHSSLEPLPADMGE